VALDDGDLYTMFIRCDGIGIILLCFDFLGCHLVYISKASRRTYIGIVQSIVYCSLPLDK